MACSDHEFVAYIKRKQDSFEEGTPIQVDNLMKNAADKYKTLLQKGKWNAPDANEAKIMALQAEIRKLKDTKKGTNSKKEKESKSKKKDDERPQWFSKRPAKEKLHKAKEWKGRKWYFCHPDTGGKCDGIWRQHLQSECKGKGYKVMKSSEQTKSKRKGEKNDGSKAPKKKRTLKLEQALTESQATAELDEREASSSDTDE